VRRPPGDCRACRNDDESVRAEEPQHGPPKVGITADEPEDLLKPGVSVDLQVTASDFTGERMRLLIVEDDRFMAELLRQGLAEEGHCVDVAHTGPDAATLTATSQYDVIVLDVMLPGLDGCELARRLRQRGDRTPILMLTARDADADVVAGLDAGADDYLTKPFAFDVLLARVRAVARRGPAVQGVLMRVGDLSLDASVHDVRRGGNRLALTRTEYGLLEFLMRRAGTIATRRRLIDGVWGHDRNIEDNTLDAFIHLLRLKVDGAGHTRLIHTVRGVGYCVREEPFE
jgi:DNA-binding response OmpR family regulator